MIHIGLISIHRSPFDWKIISPVSRHPYRTHSGAEIDLILEGNFGILPIEIKYGSTVLARQLRAMTEFIQEHRLPFGVLINQADKIEWLTKNIIQIPAGYL